MSGRNDSLPGTFQDDMEMQDISTADYSSMQRGYFTSPIIDDPWASSIQVDIAEGSSLGTQADMESSFREETPSVGSIRTHSELELSCGRETPVAARCILNLAV